MSETDAEKEGFLSRWSRRKRDAVERPLAEAAPDISLSEAAQAGALAEAPAEEQPLPGRAACPIPEVPEIDPASLPPVESLTIESDFSQFLRPGVPTLLRNAALRRMWSLDPAIRDYIGPVDYQWDFNTPGGLPFGFSNELVGDVSKLLAQAIGKIEELAGEDQDGQVADGTGVEEGPANAASASAAVPGSAPAAALEPGAPADLSPPDLPAAHAIALPDAAASPAGPTPFPRRRHGGALPS